MVFYRRDMIVEYHYSIYIFIYARTEGVLFFGKGRVFMIKSTKKRNDDIELNKLQKKEELDLKIRNRFSWLIIGSVSIIVIGTMYAFIFEDLQINFITLVTLIIAFFSIYLSSLFYFKTTEQSNQFYDRSFNHTRQIQVLLSQMEGKFNKSLDVLERGNETIREKIEDGKGLKYLGEANSNIQVLEKRKEKLLEDRVFSKFEMTQEEKENIMQELHKLEKERSLLQYQLNELLEKTDLENELNQLSNENYNNEDLKKWYQNKKGSNSFPGAIYEIIYNVGPEDILNMSNQKLKELLRGEFLSLEKLDKDNKYIILNALINIGFVDEETNDISDELLKYMRKEAMVFLE